MKLKIMAIVLFALAAHICQLLLPGTNIFQIKMDAMEKFKLTKGM